jgi:hypothetical protein
MAYCCQSQVVLALDLLRCSGNGEVVGEAFPDWFGSGASLYTLFQIMTLENWSMVLPASCATDSPMPGLLPALF